MVAENEPVTGIPVTGGRVAGVQTASRLITAPVVVDAAGGWVRQVAELAGRAVPLAPVRHQLLITGPQPQINPADPIVRVVDAAVYLRPSRGGLMFGGFEAARCRSTRAGSHRRSPPMTCRWTWPCCARWRPRSAPRPRQREPPRSPSTAAALFTMSPDGRFVAGPVPQLPGLWVASGCNGSGFSSSPALGEALATWITTGAPPPGFAALAPARFGPLPDDTLVTQGLWQYAHYYDPAPPPA